MNMSGVLETKKYIEKRLELVRDNKLSPWLVQVSPEQKPIEELVLKICEMGIKFRLSGIKENAD